ncbi:type VI secretion system contractile sheath large subunit [Vibrio sp. S4M6]|uniref:type VI secretion system contractile sheath domain-containing protein n=1 Tax=Vibrio sinus TaxID=2946865 RepID=UPI00202A9B3F|nr:type VI secretion system contractile sheath large subunit [Vibrio sinus]MCL9781225.1 type VI secretion system contractile sheath large subunit [Vibrio sinus]
MINKQPRNYYSTLLTSLPWQALIEYAKESSTPQFKAKLARILACLDTAISKQLSYVVQHHHFKALEASWKGLKSLAELPFSHRRIKVKLLDSNWNEVAKDLNHHYEIKQSALYKKLYCEELDTAGGTPFGVVLIDHNIASDYRENESYDDLYTLQLLSELGEVALCPMVLGVDECFFGDVQRRQLHDNSRIERILDSDDFQSWQLLRQKSSARFLHLVLPEHLLRQPYHQYVAGFEFKEQQNHCNALWGNSAYLLISNIIREFERISWFGFLRAYDKHDGHGAIVRQSESVCAKVDLFSEDDGFWAEQGFVPLTSLYLSDHKGFFSNQSVWKTEESSRQLGMLQTNLMACRFGHYIKAQIRDQIGRYDSADECKRSLERWLQHYVSDVDYGEDSIMARYPLKACQIRITTSDRDRTHYLCEIMLQPQYQYEIVDAQVVLTTVLPASELEKRE